MKVRAQCGFCIARRGLAGIERSTEDEKIRFEAIRQLMTFLGDEFKWDSIPARIGTERCRLTKRITKNPDPYEELKTWENEKAMEFLPEVRRALMGRPEGYERFKEACKASTLGNALDPDILGHEYGFDVLRRMILEEEFSIDDTRSFFDLASRSSLVLFLADNAGEIAFDRLLVEQLKELGCSVVVAVKEGAVLNDVTMADAIHVRMDEVADELVTTGTDSVGLNFDEVSTEFLRIVRRCDLIVAKGMGHYETIPEDNIPKPVVFLFKAKCDPVADSVRVKKGENVALVTWGR